MSLRVCGYYIKYSVWYPDIGGYAVFSVFPPKKRWRFIDEVIKGEIEAPETWEISLRPLEGSIPVYVTEHEGVYTACAHQPNEQGANYSRAYLKVTGGGEICDVDMPV